MDGSEKYELFHIHIVSHPSDPKPSILSSAIPGRVMRIRKSEIDALPELIVSTLMLFEGRTLQEVLDSWDTASGAAVRNSLKDLVVSTSDGVEL